MKHSSRHLSKVWLMDSQHTVNKNLSPGSVLKMKKEAELKGHIELFKLLYKCLCYLMDFSIWKTVTFKPGTNWVLFVKVGMCEATPTEIYWLNLQHNSQHECWCHYLPLSQPRPHYLKCIWTMEQHQNGWQFKSPWLWNVHLIEIDLLCTYSNGQGHAVI